MQKHSRFYRRIDRLFENAIVFNTYQLLVDGGKTRQIRRFLSDLPYRSVLDIGCGTGNWVKLAPDRYLGIDSSDSFVAACRRRYRHDPQKQFVQADATTVDLKESFDLALLVSVLHHLSDRDVASLLSRLVGRVQYLFVLDLYPIERNPISKWLYKMDRGAHIRSPTAQESLLVEGGLFREVKRGDYYSTGRLYRHTLFLLEPT